MNNPFERDRNVSASPVNNPFDSTLASARNRFPDLSQSSTVASPSPMIGADTSSWPQNSYGYDQFSQQAHQQTGIYSFTPTASSPYAPTPHSFGNTSNASFRPATSPYGVPGFAGGVASGGSYSLPPLVSPPAGYGSLSQNVSVHPQLSQFDPLSASNSSTSTPFGQIGYGPFGSASLPSQYQSEFQDGLDPGTLVWHPRSMSAPGVQLVSGFNGQTTVQVPIRAHNYTANDHPRNVIATHRVELEQWDQYGWRQSLNSLENLRIVWERIRDDVSRLVDAGAPPHENAVYRKMKQEAGLKIDDITAAYLQMQEVFASYRQSPDPSSKKRVRECLNAGLRNLPDWP